MNTHYISLTTTGARVVVWSDRYDGPSPCAWLALGPGQTPPTMADIRAEAERRSTGGLVSEVRVNDHLSVGIPAAPL